MLQSKKILIGITGGIAAYKTLELIRLLKQAGADVKVCLTRPGSRFVTANSCQALVGEPIYHELFDDRGDGMQHIHLAKWADFILNAPTTASTLAKLSHGYADDLLSNVVLAYSGALAVAPAMNQQMWHHPATQHNIATLKSRGVLFFGPGLGLQACGDYGLGRLIEPSELLARIEQCFVPKKLAQKTVLITAGPTQEPLDPVRYLGNNSSGQMGYALARAAQWLGAKVHLVSGPCALPDPTNITVHRVRTAQQMHDQVLALLKDTDIFMGAAAVADYRPVKTNPNKIKKNQDQMTIDCVKNPDILADVARHPNRPFTIGFAAETENLIENAAHKLHRKACDMVVANLVGHHLAMNQMDNAVTILHQDGSHHALPMQNKASLAMLIWQHVLKHASIEQ